MTQATSHAYEKLAALMEKEIDQAAALDMALRVEKDILSDKDFDGLEIVTAKKQTIVDALNALDAERQQLLHECGYGADRAGVEAFIDAQTGAHRQRLEELWRRLLDTVGACQQQNLVNGSIIGMSMRHCTQAMAVLCGQDPKDALYDPRGNASTNTQRQRHVKA
jgi:flagellar biosynthesis/type III secretory pathway chaperone